MVVQHRRRLQLRLARSPELEGAALEEEWKEGMRVWREFMEGLEGMVTGMKDMGMKDIDGKA